MRNGVIILFYNNGVLFKGTNKIWDRLLRCVCKELYCTLERTHNLFMVKRTKICENIHRVLN